ncbi:putative peptide/nitrate transporter [Zea mays]|uniref:Putative peptide/nitrate transporter n=1 Tax=Zea mays TaxID=4577 RepID=A0A1D6NQ69_MAIZE|nr:putative peptide/nitrate transporter [Zea mays]
MEFLKEKRKKESLVFLLQSPFFPPQPAEKYPHVFSKDSVFGRFPYLLPCLSVSAFATLVLISCEWLPETIHKHKVPEMDTKAFKALSSKEGYCDPPRKKKSLLQNRPWISTLLPYCFFSLHDTAYSEILSLWAVSDRKYGGLSFSTEDTGQVLAMAGASLLVYQLVIYRWVHRILGTVNSARIASAVSILVLATYPFMTYLSGVKLSLALCSAAMMRSALAITVTTGISLLQNNAVVRMKSSESLVGIVCLHKSNKNNVIYLKLNSSAKNKEAPQMVYRQLQCHSSSQLLQ